MRKKTHLFFGKKNLPKKESEEQYLKGESERDKLIDFQLVASRQNPKHSYYIFSNDDMQNDFKKFVDNANKGNFNIYSIDYVRDIVDHLQLHEEFNSALLNLLIYWEDKLEIGELDHYLLVYFQRKLLGHMNAKLRDKIGEIIDVYKIQKVGLVFISYNHDEIDYVKILNSFLESSYLSVWYDKKDLMTGDYWNSRIKENIKNCSVMIVIMTPKGEDSPHVNNEIDIAMKNNKPILPLLLRGACFEKLKDIHFYKVKNGNLPPQSFIKEIQMKC